MRIQPHHIFILTLAVLLGACKPSAKLEETTPKFNFLTDTVVTAYGDTLMLKWNKKEGVKMDSIAAGDTARLLVYVDGVFHGLTEISLSLSDKEAAELLLTDHPAGTDNTLADEPDSDEKRIPLDGEKTRIPFVFRYHALKASKDASVVITATSQASADNNTAQITLNLPVKKTPAPELYFPSDTVYTDRNDTLKVQYVSSVYRMDALATGDAARLAIVVNGVRNQLKQLRITPANKSDAVLVWPDKSELDKVFLSTSDYDNGIFDMDGTSSVLVFPFKLQAVNENAQFGMTIEAVSDAPHGYGVSSFELKTPIAEKQ